MNSRIDAWQLQGHTALVTGASKGIGYAAARELAGLGADLLLVARDEDHLEQVRVELGDDFPGIEVMAFGADLTEAEGRLAVFDWIADLAAPLSLLVNNAGGAGAYVEGGSTGHHRIAPHDDDRLFVTLGDEQCVFGVGCDACEVHPGDRGTGGAARAARTTRARR